MKKELEKDDQPGTQKPPILSHCAGGVCEQRADTGRLGRIIRGRANVKATLRAIRAHRSSLLEITNLSALTVQMTRPQRKDNAGMKMQGNE